MSWNSLEWEPMILHWLSGIYSPALEAHLVTTCSTTRSFLNYCSDSYQNHRRQEGISHLQRYSDVACLHHSHDSSAHSYSSPIIHWCLAYWYCLMAADSSHDPDSQMLHIYSYTYHLTVLLMHTDHDPQYINPCTRRVDSPVKISCYLPSSQAPSSS